MKELTIIYLSMIVPLVVCEQYAEFTLRFDGTGDRDERGLLCNQYIHKHRVSTIFFSKPTANGIENPCQCNVTVYVTSTSIQLSQLNDAREWQEVWSITTVNKFSILLETIYAEISNTNVSSGKIDLRRDTLFNFPEKQGYKNELRCNMVMKKNDSVVDPVVKTTTTQEPTTTRKLPETKTTTTFPETPQAPNDGPVTASSISTFSPEDTTNQTQMNTSHMLPTILIVVIILAVLVLVIIAVALISLHKMRGYICTKNKKEQSTNNQYAIISQNESSFSKDIPSNNNLNQNGGVLNINADEEIDNKDTTYVNAPTNSNNAQVTNGVEQTEYAEIKIGELAPKEKPEPSNENAGLTYAELSFHDQQNQGNNVSDLYAKPNKQK